MSTESSSDRLRPRTAWLLLVVILAGALGVRLWYASYRPDAGRFWDERYALQNVYSIMNEGTLQPVSSYYPSPVFNLPAAALLATSERLHAVTGWSGFDLVWGTWLRPNGYLLLRGFQSLFGVAAVVVIFLLGTTLLSRGASLVAALVFAFMPWQIHASGYFKPDALLVLTVLLALHWSVRAMLRPGRGRAALAGLGVALAASAKLTGVLTAVPLAVGLLMLARRDKRRLLELLLAGVTSAASFVLMNPYWRAYPAWAMSLKDDYAMRARWQEMTPRQAPARALEFLADPYALGLVGTVIAVIGMLLLILALRRIREPERRAAALALVSFPVLWVGVYAFETAYFKPNNMLPITPVATLLLAAVLAATWNLARLRWKPLRAQVVTALALATIAWLWVRPGVVYVYDTVTPSTLQSMNHRLERHGVLDAGRLIVSEAGVVPARWRGGRRFDGKAAVLEVEDLTDAPAGLLRDSDAVIGTADGVERAAGAISQQGADRRTLRVSPGLGRLRGPPLVAKLAAWQPAGAPIQLELTTCGKDCRSARVPASEHPGEVGSIVVWLKTRPFHEAVPPGLSLDGRELTLFPARVQPRARYYGTGRFSLGDQPLALRLEGGQFAGRIAVALHRWVPPDS